MENYLMHHGILGQKWGVRQYQNKDGSYTSLGKQRRSGNQAGNEELFKSFVSKNYDSKLDEKIRESLTNDDFLKVDSELKKLTNTRKEYIELSETLSRTSKKIRKYADEFYEKERKVISDYIKSDYYKDIEELAPKARNLEEFKEVLMGGEYYAHYWAYDTPENLKKSFNMTPNEYSKIVKTYTKKIDSLTKPIREEYDAKCIAKIGATSDEVQKEHDKKESEIVDRQNYIMACIGRKLTGLSEITQQEYESHKKENHTANILGGIVHSEYINRGTAMKHSEIIVSRHLPNPKYICSFDDEIRGSELGYGRRKFLAHYGIKGQHWDERRFQNVDGTLTPAGKERYSEGTSPRSATAGMSPRDIQSYYKSQLESKYSGGGGSGSGGYLGNSNAAKAAKAGTSDSEGYYDENGNYHYNEKVKIGSEKKEASSGKSSGKSAATKAAEKEKADAEIVKNYTKLVMQGDFDFEKIPAEYVGKVAQALGILDDADDTAGIQALLGEGSISAETKKTGTTGSSKPSSSNKSSNSSSDEKAADDGLVTPESTSKSDQSYWERHNADLKNHYEAETKVKPKATVKTPGSVSSVAAGATAAKAASSKTVSGSSKSAANAVQSVIASLTTKKKGTSGGGSGRR